MITEGRARRDLWRPSRAGPRALEREGAARDHAACAAPTDCSC
ncbi:hypothetical protein [Lysobacter gummosus]